jgi:DNA-binding NtrC family response regulator
MESPTSPSVPTTSSASSKDRPLSDPTNPTVLPTLKLRELEALAIEQAIVQARGNVHRIVELLGMGRATFYRRVQEPRFAKVLAKYRSR